MGKSGKRTSPVERRVDGFVWLARHARKADIVSFVRGAKDNPPDWLKADRSWPKVARDRAIWKAAHPDGKQTLSLREAADAVQGYAVSYQTVANVLAVYADASGPNRPDDAKRLALKRFAKPIVTRELIEQFDRKEVTAVQVAEMIGNGADYRNALYWINRMRDVFAKQDAASEGGPKAKKVRKRG